MTKLEVLNSFKIVETVFCGEEVLSILIENNDNNIDKLLKYKFLDIYDLGICEYFEPFDDYIDLVSLSDTGAWNYYSKENGFELL